MILPPLVFPDRMLIGSLFTLWLLNKWCYNQVQKQAVHRYLLNFSLGLCVLILFGDIILSQKSVKNDTQKPHALILPYNSILYTFSNF